MITEQAYLYRLSQLLEKGEAKFTAQTDFISRITSLEQLIKEEADRNPEFREAGQIFQEKYPIFRRLPQSP